MRLPLGILPERAGHGDHYKSPLHHRGQTLLSEEGWPHFTSNVGLRFDTSYLDVTIQEVAKFKILFKKINFKKALSRIFEIEALKKF